MTRIGGGRGFEIRHISVDIDRRQINLPVRPGVTVLYGRNGVGKTRILSALPQGAVTLEYDLHDRQDPRRTPRFLKQLWPSHTHHLEVAEAFASDSPIGDSYFDDEITGTFTEVAERLHEFAVRCSLVDEIGLDQQTAQRVWGVLLAVVHSAYLDDTLTPVIVDAIIEMLHSGIVTIEPNSLSYRAILSPEMPAVTALVNKANKKLREEYEAIVASGTEDLPWSDEEGPQATFNAGAGGLVRRLVDDPFMGSGVDFDDGWDYAKVGQPAPGAVALRESLRRTHDYPFEFLVESSLDPDVATRRWFDAGLVGIPSLVDFIDSRLNSEWDRAQLRHNCEAFDQMDVKERIETLIIWLQAVGGSDAFLFELDNPMPHTVDLAVTASELASDLYRRLLRGAPPLRLTPQPRRLWDSRGRFEWRSVDPSGTEVSLGQLSATQRRWAMFAIGLALSSPTKQQIVILDEPEMGLHRSAEEPLLEGLRKIAIERGLIVITASHSPAFLRPDRCALHHVDREPDTNQLTIQPMGEVEASRIAELGLVPSDLLQLVRTVVLVEGEHDRWVLEELFGEQLGQHGVLTIPLRGAKALKATADAQLLFDFTSARVIVMLDNESTERVEMIWNEAIVARSSGGNPAAIIDILKQLDAHRTVEGKALQEFCTRSVMGDAASRLGFQMLSKADIIEYFDPSAFLPKYVATKPPDIGWQQLRAKYQEWRQINRTHADDFKTWLRKTYRARFDEQTFRRAVRAQDSIHDDFVSLLNRLTTST